MHERAKKEAALRVRVGFMGVLFVICSVLAATQFMSGAKQNPTNVGQMVAQMPTK